jgi:FkbM family methyltransferase
MPDGRGWAAPVAADALMLWREIFEDGVYGDAAARLRPGDVVFDVGAHTGLSTLYFAQRAPGVRILAFEPAAATFACLTRNLAAYVAGATAYPYALGEADGQTTFTYYPHAPSQSGRYASRAADDRLTGDYLRSSGLEPEQIAYLVADLHAGRSETVPMRTVSSVLAERRVPRIALLKIDVERSELDVLTGVAAADWSRIDSVVAEVHDIDGRVAQVRRMLAGHGFSVAVHQERWLTGSELFTVTATSPASPHRGM